MFDLDLSALSLLGNRVRPAVGPVANLTRQSIILSRLFFFATDARVRLARDRSEIGPGGMMPAALNFESWEIPDGLAA
ncbi:MAG: hypothetical protein K8H87_03820 [Pseudorhodoplanes sp.]|nr:hypothetical protein [Pseudorhodoplanes sp.]